MGRSKKEDPSEQTESGSKSRVFASTSTAFYPRRRQVNVIWGFVFIFLEKGRQRKSLTI